MSNKEQKSRLLDEGMLEAKCSTNSPGVELLILLKRPLVELRCATPQKPSFRGSGDVANHSQECSSRPFTTEMIPPVL